MNQAVIQERQANQATKEWKTAVTSLMRLGPDILAPKPRPTPRKRQLPALIRTAIDTPVASPIATSATAIPSRTAARPIATQATPSKRVRAAAKRPKKLIVRLPIRVTTAELEQGRRGQIQQEGGHVTGAVSQSGRAMRQRRGRKL